MGGKRSNLVPRHGAPVALLRAPLRRCSAFAVGLLAWRLAPAACPLPGLLRSLLVSCDRAITVRAAAGVQPVWRNNNFPIMSATFTWGVENDGGRLFFSSGCCCLLRSGQRRNKSAHVQGAVVEVDRLF